MRYLGPVAAVVLLLAACGGSSAEPAQDEEPAPTTLPGTVPAPSTSPSPTTGAEGEAEAIELPDRSVITQEDNGSSFTTRLGNRVELQLSADYVWSMPEAAGPVQLVSINYFDDPGFTAWEILIEEAGTVTISARGMPNCEAADCESGEIDFSVTIEVSAD